MRRVSVPDDSWLPVLADQPVDVVVWDCASPQPEGRLDLVVWPYTVDVSSMAAIDPSRIGLIQSQALGYDGVEQELGPGATYANAVDVHEESTAELAVALLLAAARDLDVFAAQQARRAWAQHWTSSLNDRRVMLLGVGGIGSRVATRLTGFGCELVRVGTRPRDDDSGHVHGIDELDDLLPTVDAVVVAVPLTPATERLVDAGFLARLRDGAIVVNVARGLTADTAAVIAEDGRIRYASDVFEVEPLPADHPLWSTPGVIVTPHTGGRSSAMRPRIEAVVRDQVRRLLAGEEPAHVVVRT